MRRETRYTVRFTLRNGAPRTFTVYAFNKLDADCAAYQKLVALDGDDAARTALRYGAERY
jgi:hypothetical protein